MNLSDLTRNADMLRGPLRKHGYMRWWHSFSGVSVTTGESRTFFVEFFIINPALGRKKPVLGQHPYYQQRGMKPSYVMVKAGAFPDANGNPGKELHAFYPISALQVTGSPLIMQVDDCTYREDHISGSVEVSPAEARQYSRMTDAGYMQWDLEVHKAVSCHTGIFGGRLAEFVNALESYWHGEGIRSFFRGSVILDGEEFHVQADYSYGYADKHWGRNFNSPWLQLSCTSLTSGRTGHELRHSALALNGCCPRFLFIPLKRKLMLQLTYTGEDFVFTRCKWETKSTNKRFIWHILAQNKDAVIKISGSCTKEQMMYLSYENPNGEVSDYPLWAGASGIGTIKLYRKTPEGRVLLDTLDMKHLMCEYRRE